MILHFKQGEFSSPDRTKCLEDRGKVILKFISITRQKGNFELSSEVGEGELLGKYYNNFSGKGLNLFHRAVFF
jgi:hypothetical protein